MGDLEEDNVSPAQTGLFQTIDQIGPAVACFARYLNWIVLCLCGFTTSLILPTRFRIAGYFANVDHARSEVRSIGDGCAKRLYPSAETGQVNAVAGVLYPELSGAA